VGEVEAVAGADLQHPTGQASQQGATVLGRALGVLGRTEAGNTRAKIGCRFQVMGGGRSRLAMTRSFTTLADVRRRDYRAP
jgi:hypothetical protein